MATQIVSPAAALAEALGLSPNYVQEIEIKAGAGGEVSVRVKMVAPALGDTEGVFVDYKLVRKGTDGEK